MWTTHDTLLLVYAVIAIAGIIALITTKLRMHAFPALMIGALFVGLAAGSKPPDVVTSFTDGVGSTLGNVGVVLALGTMLGKLLAESGGAEQIASTLLRSSGPRRAPWIMALVAMIVGIPLFFEIGVILLIPIIFTMARQVEATAAADGTDNQRAVATRTASTYMLVGIPALAGLSVLHGLVPPHPGPLIAIDAVKADLGTTLLLGLIVAIPTVAIAGPLFAQFVTRYVNPRPPERLIEQVAQPVEQESRPGFGTTLGTILLPVVLMLVRTIADITLDENSPVRRWADFIGEPIVALLIALLVAMYTFGFARGFGGKRVATFVGDALAPAASILLIIGAGGGFKQMLIDTGVGESIAKAAEHTSLSALLLAWLVAVLIRLATGSATVATITAAGIMAPLVAHDAAINRPLLALAIGAGSLFLSHVNDAGFWLVKEFFGMSVGETFKTWSAMETIISVLGLVFVLLLNLII